MVRGIPIVNDGTKMAAEDAYLRLTVAFAPYEKVMPVVAGLFRATYGYSRMIEDCAERQWARLHRLLDEGDDGDVSHSLDSVRVVEPAKAANATIIENYDGVDVEHLAALLPEVSFFHFGSEYHRKDTERHGYSWHENGKTTRDVYFHHNYQYPGWDWKEDGTPLPWEDTDRMKKKLVSARCDRALILDYAAELGCDLHGPLADGQWCKAILLYQIDEGDMSDCPPLTGLGDKYRKEAVNLGFGRGEEDITFQAQIEDAKFYACLGDHQKEITGAIRKTRSAKRLLELMKTRGISPDWQDEYSVDLWLWQDAFYHVYEKFPNAPEIIELENLAKAETKNHRFALNDLRLRNFRATALGEPMEDDPDALPDIFRGWIDD